MYVLALDRYTLHHSAQAGADWQRVTPQMLTNPTAQNPRAIAHHSTARAKLDSMIAIAHSKVRDSDIGLCESRPQTSGAIEAQYGSSIAPLQWIDHSVSKPQVLDAVWQAINTGSSLHSAR